MKGILKKMCKDKSKDNCKDCKGKMIFEGDILEVVLTISQTVKVFKVVFEKGKFVLVNGYEMFDFYDMYSPKIIDNVHELEGD